jgi:hypothetical protein
MSDPVHNLAIFLDSDDGLALPSDMRDKIYELIKARDAEDKTSSIPYRLAKLLVELHLLKVSDTDVLGQIEYVTVPQGHHVHIAAFWRNETTFCQYNHELDALSVKAILDNDPEVDSYYLPSQTVRMLRLRDFNSSFDVYWKEKMEGIPRYEQEVAMRLADHASFKLIQCNKKTFVFDQAAEVAVPLFEFWRRWWRNELDKHLHQEVTQDVNRIVNKVRNKSEVRNEIEKALGAVPKYGMEWDKGTLADATSSYDGGVKKKEQPNETTKFTRGKRVVDFDEDDARNTGFYYWRQKQLDRFQLVFIDAGGGFKYKIDGKDEYFNLNGCGGYFCEAVPATAITRTGLVEVDLDTMRVINVIKQPANEEPLTDEVHQMPILAPGTYRWTPPEFTSHFIVTINANQEFDDPRSRAGAITKPTTVQEAQGTWEPVSTEIEIPGRYRWTPDPVIVDIDEDGEFLNPFVNGSSRRFTIARHVGGKWEKLDS